MTHLVFSFSRDDGEKHGDHRRIPFLCLSPLSNCFSVCVYVSFSGTIFSSQQKKKNMSYSRFPGLREFRCKFNIHTYFLRYTWIFLDILNWWWWRRKTPVLLKEGGYVCDDGILSTQFFFILHFIPITTTKFLCAVVIMFRVKNCALNELSKLEHFDVSGSLLSSRLSQAKKNISATTHNTTQQQ